MNQLCQKLKLRPNLSRPFITDLTFISERKKGNVERQVVNEVPSKANLDMTSVVGAHGLRISVQVWIYKLTTQSLENMFLNADTSIAAADIENITQARDAEVKFELNKIIDKSLSEWPEQDEVPQLKLDLQTESSTRLEQIYEEMKDMMPTPVIEEEKKEATSIPVQEIMQQQPPVRAAAPAKPT